MISNNSVKSNAALSFLIVQPSEPWVSYCKCISYFFSRSRVQGKDFFWCFKSSERAILMLLQKWKILLHILRKFESKMAEMVIFGLWNAWKSHNEKCLFWPFDCTVGQKLFFQCLNCMTRTFLCCQESRAMTYFETSNAGQGLFTISRSRPNHAEYLIIFERSLEFKMLT